ncbi:crossover junction endodeoxyribonuclease RuvC [Candidatus Roizmanbacteria bacterium]|nr:crossover junction endodeoxyribonuclease RuvC [Candidatus Roizmanbacteria bacterium]
MHVLSLDPGFEKVGYAVFDKESCSVWKYCCSGLIKTAKTLPLEKRLNQIYTELQKIIAANSIDMIVIEQLFLFKNQKTFIQVAQAQGVMMLAASEKDIPIKFFTPLQIKEMITGYGNSDKKGVHKMLKYWLKQDVEVADDDQSDAIAAGLAFCFLNQNL